ncbi:tRNA (cytosine(32)/uridine(32)-2'-O)-methyltransferase TrmJ [Rodentibacter myodis]|uniref:tRNA (cytidine/uridine-2'-O-)-methyltransferase TrmJ n=1 Tax=Rodentibacter myodis TaxID=1907939 RepID=A0A1V3JKF3_9PAST|nr:tRNA (cytosine(32)/uridine(32)-2'-O)-methyltransferase TrmJ [Rodentibacter myodis]OOF56929.1 tRNA (cytosine(32)/uridine(32)-2'-O)-methyltransferase TrmJ [Rodentibacter myodis]
MFNHIRIVLVETSHSGNIGSAARAMKTMGLSQLYLVSPKAVDEQSIALSAGAEDIVRAAHIVSEFDEAIADCSLVIGTSARLRHLQNTLIELRECGEKVAMQEGNIAIVFGRERVGLHNDELLKCHYHLTIPANPDYSSLNLAMAVQLVCYELRMAFLTQKNNIAPLSLIGEINNSENRQATAQEMEYFFAHTERVYQTLGFIQNQGVMQKLRRLYLRSKPEKNELNILRGMLSAVEKHLNLTKSDS